MLVDDTDLDIAHAYRWQLSSTGYAHRIARIDGKRRMVSFHRLITNAPQGLEVDHINGDRLDNRRSNLRFVTRKQNSQNLHRARPESRSGIRGVRFARGGRWRAYAYVDGREINLGKFGTAEEADAAARAGRRRLMTHSPESAEGRP